MGLVWAIIGCLLLVAHAFGQQAPSTLVRPEGDDYTSASLARYIDQLQRQYGGSYRDVPLDVKADFFAWQLWRYHRTEYHQIYNRVVLPDAPGDKPKHLPGSDSSTWNGALLAALAYQYGVARDAETLARIRELLAGLDLFFRVTGKRGLPARNVTPEDGPIQPDQTGRYVREDGAKFVFRSEAAKGTINQLAGGYATLLLFAGNELPEDVSRRAREALAAMAMHLIEHDYHLTEADGRRTTYGDLTPLVARVGVPFNAQVAYLVIAAAHYFPADNEAERTRIGQAYSYLRHKHHVYYEDPWRNLILPQRVGGSPFVKGMNDRMHVTYAAYLGLQIDLHHARRHRLELDRKFVRQLGQTMVHSMQLLWTQHNSLCNFMWGSLVRDAQVFECILPRGRDAAQRQADYALIDGVEQLRRFRLNRFRGPGQEWQIAGTVYNDAYWPDDYYWKVNPDRVFQPSGPPMNEFACAIDYLHAYWMMRYFHLDEHPGVVQQHGAVLRRP
jgi:hypothetical protein